MLSAPETRTEPPQRCAQGDQISPSPGPLPFCFFCEVWGTCFSSEVLRLGETPKIREEAGGISRQLLQETEL